MSRCPFHMLRGTCDGKAMGKSQHIWREALYGPGGRTCVLCGRRVGRKRSP